MGILPEQHAAAENADPVRAAALDLVDRYIETMEDYDAGFSICLADHPHHEDWVKANELLRTVGRSSSLYRQSLPAPKPAPVRAIALQRRFAAWSTEALAAEYDVLQRRCWNGEAANVYPLLKDAGDELLARNVIPAQLVRR